MATRTHSAICQRFRAAEKAKRRSQGLLKRCALIAAALLPAAASATEPAPWRIAALYWSMGIPGQVAMRQGLESQAAAINASRGARKVQILPSVAGDGEAGIENQIAQMRAAIAAKVDAIIVQPADNAALSAPLSEANAAGIPVIAYDQYIEGGRLAAYRSSDNYGAGYLDGEYLASAVPASAGQIKLILVEYPRVSSTVERVDGFLDGLASSGRAYRILKSYLAVEPVSGAQAASEILKDFPLRGSVDAVFTVNDGGGLAVVSALAAAGRTEIKVATVDGDPSSVANIKAGRLTVIDSAQFCGPLGAEALKAAYAVLSGKPTPYHALVPVFPVTRETLSRYSGWLGPIPPSFKKPWKSEQPVWSGELRVVRQ